MPISGQVDFGLSLMLPRLVEIGRTWSKVLAVSAQRSKRLYQRTLYRICGERHVEILL